ncbi:MAG: BNR repeat-containing protein [Armatimonadetes bacterium]|nr:BNR repeat-containing protein [Armatimonadota bacterium]
MTLLLWASLMAAEPAETLVRTLDIGPVWAGHSVGFDLLCAGEWQFVAYYDADRQMTVASRRLTETAWHFVRLPSKLGWDSHNYVTLAADDEGLLHLSGNMHVKPLLYFRTSKPYDIDTFESATPMTGERETKVTYPRFFRGPANEFIFTYRDGSSGNGDQIFNVWDPARHTWHRLMDQALTDGEGLRNAYFVGPQPGPDGFWHLCWVWRETGDCATNHDLTYARSRDLVHWEKSDGTPLTLPIKLATGEIVAPVPEHGGIINGNTRIGFDSQKRVILSYHRYDDKGFTQICNARREAGGWKHYQATDWDYRWEFGGGGTIVFEVSIGAVTLGADGRLRQSWSNVKKGGGSYLLDEATLRPIGAPEPRTPWVLDRFGKPEGTFAGLQTRWLRRDGTQPGSRFALRWETLPANRDQARPEPWPEPSMMRLYETRLNP